MIHPNAKFYKTRSGKVYFTINGYTQTWVNGTHSELFLRGQRIEIPEEDKLPVNSTEVVTFKNKYDTALKKREESKKSEIW